MKRFPRQCTAYFPTPLTVQDPRSGGKAALWMGFGGCGGAGNGGRGYCSGISLKLLAPDAERLYPGKNPAVTRNKHGDMMEKTTKEEFEERLAQG